MNQGNTGEFVRDDCVWQDGGLLLRFPDQHQWVAVFLAFQSQSWHTDDQTGHAGPDHGTDPSTSSVSIVGALVNPRGPAPEAETVTLFNATPDDVDLAGWSLVDRAKQRMALPAVTLPAGESRRVPVTPPVQLGNRGGLVTLLDADARKVDGVAYTEDQARREGWSIVF